MKSFKEFVKEQTLSQSDAMDIMGISGEFTSDDVKKKYKELAIINHPDKGGDSETMKKINNAYDVLKNKTGLSSKTTFDWDKMDKEYQELANRIVEIVKGAFNPNVFTDYFEKVFGKPFKLEKVKYIGEHTKDSYGSPSHAGLNATFDSVDGTMSFNIIADVYLSSIKNSTGLPSPSMSLPLTATSVGFFNGRKFKLFNSFWKSFKLDAKSFNKPEEFFPEVKLKKHLKQKQLKKTFNLLLQRLLKVND